MKAFIPGKGDVFGHFPGCYENERDLPGGALANKPPNWDSTGFGYPLDIREVDKTNIQTNDQKYDH